MSRNVNPKSDTFIWVSFHGIKLFLLFVFAENEQGVYPFLSPFSIMQIIEKGDRYLFYVRCTIKLFFSPYSLKF